MGALREAWLRGEPLSSAHESNGPLFGYCSHQVLPSNFRFNFTVCFHDTVSHDRIILVFIFGFIIGN